MAGLARTEVYEKKDEPAGLVVVAGAPKKSSCADWIEVLQIAWIRAASTLRPLYEATRVLDSMQAVDHLLQQDGSPDG